MFSVSFQNVPVQYPSVEINSGNTDTTLGSFSGEPPAMAVATSSIVLDNFSNPLETQELLVTVPLSQDEKSASRSIVSKRLSTSTPVSNLRVPINIYHYFSFFSKAIVTLSR